MPAKTKNPAAVALGSIRTPRKARSSAANGRLGGRPANYLIIRHGSNAANQGMCARMPVAIVAASSREEACRIAAQSCTVYVNQRLEAIPESRARRSEWNECLENEAMSRV